MIALVLTGLAATACGGDAALPAPKESDERPAGGGDGSGSEYCDAVAGLADMDPDELDDPAKAVAALAELGEVAPADLADSFDVLSGIVEELGALDQDDPDSVSQSLEIIMDPEVQDAAEAIDSYTMEECGIDLDGEDPLDDGSLDDDMFDDIDESTTTTVDPGDTSSTGDIDLEDVDDVKDANSSATWTQKLTSTTILNDTDVTLAADSSDPVTPAEAMEACEAVRTALVTINPGVTVTISNGETPVAASPARGTCAAA